MKNRNVQNTNSFDKYLKKRLENPTFKKHYEAELQRLEVALRIAKLRKQSKLTQTQLAKKMKTTQSVVARIESGEENLTLDTLKNIASAFGKNLIISFR